jgi:4-aminobutyrate aminotransferase
MKREDLIKRTQRLIAPSLVIHSDIVVKKAQGIYLEDVGGKRYLDFTSGLAVVNVGHNHPRVVGAVKRQAEDLMHAGCMFYYEPLVEYPELLGQITPPGLASFFFSNSGAEAIEGALKLARYYTGRQGILAFTGAFHGRTLGALSLTASNTTYRNRYAPLLPLVYHAPYPYCYRCAANREPDTCSLECFEHVEIILKNLIAPEEVACAVIEPVLGEGGYVVPPARYLRRLRELCDREGILLILDEVQSGMGRTGKWFASEHFGISPDIMTMAKGIANGMPLSAVVSSEKIMAEWVPSAHGTTFGGNPVSLSAATATLKVIKEEELLENAASVGSFALERLNAIKDRYPAIGDVRGLGLMIGVEFVKNAKEPDGAIVEKIIRNCLQRGLLLIECGGDKNVLRLIPPLIITRDEMARGLDILEEAIAS